MAKTNNIVVGVLMGGPSRERSISLMSGQKILESLRRQGYKTIPIIDPDKNIVKKLNGIDVAYLAMHGYFGEDGRIQGLLETLGIPYTGSGVLASALAMDKIMSKQIFQSLNIPTPAYYHINRDNDIEKEIENCIKKLGSGGRYVVKPRNEGSSIGVSIVDEVYLLETVKHTLAEFEDIFIEEYIDGMNTTVGILGVGSRLRALPIIELIPKISSFYDYRAKYTKGGTQLIIPARLEKDLYEYTQEVAKNAHEALGCYSVSRVDIIIRENIPYVTEVNTLPGMTDYSDLPAAAKAAGISYDELVREILEYAFQR